MTGTTDQASAFGALNAPKTAVRLSRAAVLAQLRGFAFKGRVWLVPLRTARYETRRASSGVELGLEFVDLDE